MIAYTRPVVMGVARSRRDVTHDHRNTHASVPTIAGGYRDPKPWPLEISTDARRSCNASHWIRFRAVSKA